MVKLNRIYTRTGDEGMTGLSSGSRLSKDAVRVEAMGAVDEANSALGVAREELARYGSGVTSKREPGKGIGQDYLDGIRQALSRIQNDLFDLGADLASPVQEMPEDMPVLRIVPSQVDWLEQQIDSLNGEVEPLKSFVLPAGAGAYLHLARATCRRAERQMVALSRSTDNAVSPEALCYINRLSDYLFVAARYVNDRGQTDILWQPGASRT